jgi:2-iminobutanoate/2-iminopropanoate deaminase
MRRTAHTDRAPVPAGPYSQVAGVGRIVAAAGQVGRRPDGTLLDGIEAQTHQAIDNLFAVLAAGGAAPTDVISVRMFLTDVEHFSIVNEIYAARFDEPYPARTTVYVGLGRGLLVEIDALAVLPD